MVLTADEDEERMKRFEDAYTIMCTVRKSEDNVIKASKRWSRASNIPIAVSIDGRVYADMQRSPTLKHATSSRRDGNEVVGAELNGKTIADRAIKAGLESITFDRGGYLYHGRVKSLAEGAREGGLKF